MNVMPPNRILNCAPRKRVIAQVLDQAGYLILTIIALVVSAVTAEWTEQFLAVAIILGLKWICGNQIQVIQIFTHSEKEYQ